MPAPAQVSSTFGFVRFQIKGIRKIEGLLYMYVCVERVCMLEQMHMHFSHAALHEEY